MTDPACHPSLAWAASRVRASLIEVMVGTLHAAASMRMSRSVHPARLTRRMSLGERKRGR